METILAGPRTENRLCYRGNRRGITDRETKMEDPHIWLMNADGRVAAKLERGSTTGKACRTGQRIPAALYFTVQERGTSIVICVCPSAAFQPQSRRE